MNMQFTHFRVPANAADSKVGRPNPRQLFQYVKGKGFLVRSSFGQVFVKAEPNPCGGMTMCVFRNDQEEVVGVGFSLCSMSDNFEYKEGFDRALDNAVEEYEVAHGGEYLPAPVSYFRTALASQPQSVVLVI